MKAAELERAREVVRARLARVGGAGGATRREIVEAHLAFLDDPVLNEVASEHIAAGRSAGFAWRAATRASITALEQLTDARLRERADDLLDIETHVLMALAGEARPMNLVAAAERDRRRRRDASLGARRARPRQPERHRAERRRPDFARRDPRGGDGRPNARRHRRITARRAQPASA